MKRYILLVLITCVVMTLHSCSDAVQEKKLGDWDDIIKLSTRAVEFKSASDSVTIKTGGNWWWLASISVDGTHYYNFKDVNVSSSTYTIKEDCFVFRRVDKNTMFIKVNENPLGADRTIHISLQAGDYFDFIKITQKSYKEE